MPRPASECPTTLSGLDLDAFDLLAGDLLLDGLQEALAVLVLVVLGVKLGR